MRAARHLLFAAALVVPLARFGGWLAIVDDPLVDAGHRALPPLPMLRFTASDPLKHRSPGSRQRRRRVRDRRAGRV